MFDKRTQELLAESKVSIYLPYAFGEILLLVVGILFVKTGCQK